MNNEHCFYHVRVASELMKKMKSFYRIIISMTHTPIAVRHFISLIVERNEFQFPLSLQSGNRYKVIIRGLKQQHQDASSAAASDCFDVLCGGSTEFRAGDGNFIIVVTLLFQYTMACPDFDFDIFRFFFRIE